MKSKLWWWLWNWKLWWLWNRHYDSDIEIMVMISKWFWKRKYYNDSEKENITIILKKKIWYRKFWKRKYKYDMEIIWLENQNYDNNIEMMMNDMDIHNIDNDDIWCLSSLQ